MKYFILWCLLLLSSQAGRAQVLRITDKYTTRPLAGVTLQSEQPSAGAISNSTGEADITDFAGAREIWIRTLGYEVLLRSYEELAASDFRVELEPTNLELEEVVISATRWQQSKQNVAAQITSISPAAVALQNSPTAADLLGLSGKVFIQKSQQGGGSPMIRGFSTNRLVYTVDGVRMNTAIFRSGNIQNVINLDPFAIAHTEVLFGPGSVIYGSDAIGGVMSFQTLKPGLSPTAKMLVSGKAVARYATANQERTGHLDFSIGRQKWAMTSSFSTWSYDHLRQGSKGPEDYLKAYFVQRQGTADVLIQQDDPRLQRPSAYDQINWMQKLRLAPNEHWDIQYGWHYSATSPYGRYDRHNRLKDELPRYAEWDYGPQTWMMHSLDITHRSSRVCYDQFTLRLARQVFGESRISRDLNADWREVRQELVGAYSANLDFAKATHPQNTLFYGLELVYNDVASDGYREAVLTGEQRDGPDRYPQATWRSLAAYVNDEWRLGQRLTLQGGLRYNQFEMELDFSENSDYYPLPFSQARIDKGALTGSLGAVYRPSDSLLIRANLGTGFRSPNVDDIGKVFDSEPGVVVVPNPDLAAEYAYNFDLGLTKIIAGGLRLEVTGFCTLLDHALVRRAAQLGGQDSILYDGVMSEVQSLQNAAQAYVYGLQLGFEINLAEGLRFSSDINFQRGTEELDDGSLSPARHAAPFFGLSRLNYQKDKLNLQLYTTFQGARTHEQLAVTERGKTEIYALDANGQTWAPAWYTLNLKLAYALTPRLRLTAGLENITDQRYRPYSSGISGAGRNGILALNVGF